MQRCDLRQLIGHEALAAEAGLHRHDKRQIQQRQIRDEHTLRRFRLDGKADLLAVRLHIRNRGENVLWLVRLDVEHDEIRSGIAKIADVAMRPVDHQVHIQKHWRMLAHGLHDRDADRDIRHKNAVHYVNMDIVRAAGLDLTDVLAECAKVRREDGRCKFCHGCHSVLGMSGYPDAISYYNLVIIHLLRISCKCRGQKIAA